MITNERQYKITLNQRSKMKAAIIDLQSDLKKAESSEKMLLEIQINAITSEYEILNEQILNYELLKSGTILSFEAKTLTDLPQILIKARIAQNLSQSDLAKKINIKEQQIQRYEAEMYSTANLDRLSEIADALNLNISEIAEFKSEQTNIENDWHKFPVTEMYKRNWFKNFNGNLDEAVSLASNLVENFIKSIYPKYNHAFTRKHIRSGSSLNVYSLYSWQCRVATLAKDKKLEALYSKDMITSEWLYNLAKLSIQHDGPILAQKYLASYGIHLIIEPHLSKTFLDGAAMLLTDGTPVIGLTLRYDRIDNFWFVLFHEIAHLFLHLKSGNSDCYFDDLDSTSDTIESDADYFSNNALIPSEKWETNLVRYVHSEELIIEFANELNISPAIIAGRIRKETNNFTIYNNLIGLNKVRINFPGVFFGQ